jgi:acyl-CoA reductase-like NAD-dependent aldehyde dehydrogenase
MSAPDPRLVQEIVDMVLAKLSSPVPATHAAPARQAPLPTAGRAGGPVFDDVHAAVSAAKAAQAVWARAPHDTRARVIEALRRVMLDHVEDFSRRALEETGLGRYEDKLVKHRNAALSTPGLEDLETRSWSGDKGLVTEEYAPYGVIAAITPTTHPVEVLFNSMVIMIAPGNGVVFNVHPAGKNVSVYAAEIFERVIREHGGPPNLITIIREPTLETARTLFDHPDIPLIAATGGPGLVKAAFAAGKKVIAAGPGNPPVLVDHTANIRAAARHIIDGASFDNNILCFAEKEVFVVERVFDQFMQAMAAVGSVRLTPAQVDALANRAFKRDDRGHVVVNREFVGKNASVLAAAVGLRLQDSVRLLYGEGPFDCRFVQEEQMMPYLPVVRVNDVEEGINLAVRAEHGYNHSAMIHSNDLGTITRYARAINTSVLVVNGPSAAGDGGLAGEGTFSHTIASPTGEGVCTPRDFARVRRLAVYGTLHFV